MADAATLDAPETEPHSAAADHEHDHHPALEHHFEDLDQQFDAGKFGMWLFLAQEVLFFAGLFVAYTVYRWHYPEVFVEAHHFLNTTLGAFNTIVLLASSLAIAWGVRAAMRGDQALILSTHLFTLGCAGVFMGVKAIEYTHKWDEGIGAGNFYKFVEGMHVSGWHYGDYMPNVAIGSLFLGVAIALLGGAWTSKRPVAGWVTKSIGVSILAFGLGIVVAKCIMPTAAEAQMAAGHGEHGSEHTEGTHQPDEVAPSVAQGSSPAMSGDTDSIGISGSADVTSDESPKAADGEQDAAAERVTNPVPSEEQAENDLVYDPEEVISAEIGAIEPATEEEAPGGVQPAGEAAEASDEAGAAPPNPAERRRFGGPNFFGIYFIMTGVHAVHILGGMIAITWVIAKTAAGQFDPEYFLPVENVGLYWHLVDLVWIYLFPLLYLIH